MYYIQFNKLHKCCINEPRICEPRKHTHTRNAHTREYALTNIHASNKQARTH